jgi:uncharacterized protein
LDRTQPEIVKKDGMMLVRTGLALCAGLAMAGAMWAPAPATAQEPAAPRHEPEVVVTGTGTVTLSPDYAVVDLSVVTRDERAADAGADNAKAMMAVRAALKKLLGVPDDSLPTVSYSVNTEYDHDRPTGYQAQSTLEAHAPVARAGAVVDAALDAGATNVSGLRFESTKRETARLEALSRAVQQAHREAEAMARAAGGRLGSLLSANTTGALAFAGPQVERAMRTANETPISAPSLEVSATVTARWAFLPQ